MLLLALTFMGSVLNWPIAWLIIAYSRPSATMLPTHILNADSRWPSWIEKNLPPFEAFITPERLKLAADARSGKIPFDAAWILAPTPDRPVDCVQILYEWFGTSQVYWNARNFEGDDYSLHVTRFGFPFLSVIHGAGGNTRASPPTMYTYGPMGSISVWGTIQSLFLPWWPGLIANSVLYGLILWAPFVLRAHRTASARVRNRQCVECGYPLPASPSTESPNAAACCPECGAVDHEVCHFRRST